MDWHSAVAGAALKQNNDSQTLQEGFKPACAVGVWNSSVGVAVQQTGK